MLTKLVFRDRFSYHLKNHRHDIDRIIKICAQAGYSLRQQEAASVWENYSEDYYCAGWIGLPEEDKDILDVVLEYMEPENNNQDNKQESDW